MTITEVKNEGEITLKLEGRVDTITAPELQQAILVAFQKENKIVLDFEKVEYISSAGLRALLIGEKTAKSKGGSMVITGASDAVKDVFNVTGFLKILTFA
ncbi:MAG: STAS domain-containing protein [Lachnospiraceae bacterium]|nr:STAS domain-containing protein [Lachnospiraceae bacterium]